MTSLICASPVRSVRGARIGGVSAVVRLAGAVSVLAVVIAMPRVAAAHQTLANPLCPDNTALFFPEQGQDIVLPPGYTVSVFKAGLNFPTGIAFRGNSNGFEVYVLESGHGLPSRCNDQSAFGSGDFDPTNPFTPDILVFDQSGKLIRGPLAKPTSDGGGLQPEGPSVDIAFENGFDGGRLFATDSNQATHAHNGQNNSSRIVTVDPSTGKVTPFITDLPTGDHPTEQLAFKGDGWVYWSQGSTTNSGVVGLDNGGGQNQQDIPCQDIVLSQNVFDSGEGTKTSGYSPFGVQQPGAMIAAFTGASHHGVCDGAILRARLDSDHPEDTIEPFSWGYRNGYAIRFAPLQHTLKGGLLVGEDGADERGARPSNNAPDNIQLAQQNPDGTPDYHGWPDQYGFLPAFDAVFNPVGGPGDDLCVPDPTNPPSLCSPASLQQILTEDIPIEPVLDFPPQPITEPLATEAADSSFTGIEFVPDSFVRAPVKPGAALYALEGDFGFSKGNATDPAPETGHEIKLINFSNPGDPLALQISRFAHNTTNDQAFGVGLRGFNRPTQVRMGPDNCLWVADYGAVRDFGQSSPELKFVGASNGPLVQIPGTGVIWRICLQ
jgi:glucose/arabinose dehydrogenase